MSVAESFDVAAKKSYPRAVNTAAIVAGITAAKLIIQFAGIRNYGFFRDELYYLACGQHLAWGYIDQPPLIAAVAWLVRHVFGNSIVGVRLFPVLAGVAIVLLTALLARELDGGPFAQILAAVTILFTPSYLAFDGFLSMNAFEPLLWLLCVWLVVRIVKGESPRLWLAFGVVAGIGLENKHTMLAFGFSVVVALILAGKMHLLMSRWAWLALGIAFLIFLPNLIWEIRHGFPQVEVVRNAQEFKNIPTSPWSFISDQALFLDPLALPVWLGGLIWLLFAPGGKRFRFLAFAYLVVTAIVMTFREKAYYPLPAYPMLIAAGGVAFERIGGPGGRLLRKIVPSLVVIGGLAGLPLAVPILPIPALIRYSRALPFARVKTERDSTGQLSQLYGDMLPWQNISRHIATVYHGLPAAEQSDCAILGGNYGEAGAIDYYGPSLGLPKAISGHNSYYDWGPRNYTGSCIIIFGERAEQYTQYFRDV
ncbi:MAG TPA: glycosyltransferase family 39 protein, partial [Candidatus Acidoferrales bacterium]|nr:glycosyltransferase family 39 protein [Candidatus Acidoferrales bacterium]